ncbi:response regulator [Leptospira jelokensis]|uniref:response regulator n=1 Tax=Leptospira jelokensis TaxID=2484931 RepID=UPI00109108DE|nr:response regulator [Leptospira jelokensis]TGM02412.1 response regulator [Leptospira jelokensis]
MANAKFEKVILAVDDEATVLKMMEHLLKRKFSGCYVASNGKEALNLLEKGVQIDFVITDISMPVMDGYELRKKIFQFNPNIPVIAITGHTDEEHLKKLEEYHFTKVFFKPFKKADLESIGEVIKNI